MRNSSLNRSLSKYRKITLQEAALGEMGERADVSPLPRAGGGDGLWSWWNGDTVSPACGPQAAGLEATWGPAPVLVLAGLNSTCFIHKNGLCAVSEAATLPLRRGHVLSTRSWCVRPASHWAEPWGVMGCREHVDLGQSADGHTTRSHWWAR